MLFNSYAFIFLFLPVALAGYYILGRLHYRWASLWLLASSLAFYAFQQKQYVGLFCLSIAFNFTCGLFINKSLNSLALKKGVLALGITGNLGLLFYFKYSAYLTILLNLTRIHPHSVHAIILPLGISFYTFTQIAYLVDCWRGIARDTKPANYALFVSFFPHLMAGPILHHSEIMPQFSKPKTFQFDPENLIIGFMIFIFGLAKKVLLADTLSSWVREGFQSPESLGIYASWAAVLSYTLQIYFDFSGYSDMALGLARMFDVRFPLNFNSPYKSRSLIEFWRRWHMTLSRFLRDYLYIPLGGNRGTKLRRYVNLMITMVLGGLWHGADLTFVIWGALHGLCLVLNHGWRGLAKYFSPQLPNLPLYVKKSWDVFSCLLTFLAVTVAWVFFRAPSTEKALTILKGMVGLHGGMGALPKLHQGFEVWKQPIMIGVLLAVSWWMPNTQQMMSAYLPEFDQQVTMSRLKWKLNMGWALAMGAVFTFILLTMSGTTEFLYFKF